MNSVTIDSLSSYEPLNHQYTNYLDTSFLIYIMGKNRFTLDSLTNGNWIISFDNVKMKYDYQNPLSLWAEASPNLIF